MRRHLYLQIYAAFLGVAVLCAAAAAVTVHLTSDSGPNAYKAAVADLLAESLPQQSGPKLTATLERLGARLKLDIVLFDVHGAVLAATDTELAARTTAQEPERWSSSRDDYAMRLRLPDGRTLAAVARGDDHDGHRWRFLRFLSAMLIVAAIGCYPIARRITRRLERLQRTVDQFGSGQLDARIAVHGRDEVARLAISFNRAFSRIQELVNAQRRVLASASHELRSPMTRLRMAIELLSEGQAEDKAAREALLADSIRDIDELNALVEDVLLSSRLEARVVSRPFAIVDMTALLRDAAKPGGASVTGETLSVMGDERLLARLLRNLFDNAARYGGGTTVEASIHRADSRVLVRVCDRGPGVAAGDRERIFEPFYRPEGHREGTDGGVGLGLALVRQIAIHHQGSVRYRDREGGGSCFELELPVAFSGPIA